MKSLPTDTNQLIQAGAARLLARATDAYGLDAGALAARLRATLEKYLWRDAPDAPTREAEAFLDGLRADDLCLVVACERGDAVAWEDLVNRFGPTVRSAARAATGQEDAAEDVAQSIWAELHGLRTRADGRPAGKLGYYSGRGSLAGWLRAVVAQLAVDQHRKQARFVQTEEDAEFDRLAQHSADDAALAPHTVSHANPEDELTTRRTARDVERALAQTLQELPPESRLLLKLYYFDDLRLRDIGAVLGFHEATASRKLARLQTEVRQRVEKILAAQHGWTASETARFLTEAAAHLNTNLELLLTAQRKNAE